MKFTRDPARDKVQNLRWGSHVAGTQPPTDQKRLAILRTAAQLFNERGFYETTLNDLAERLHVTKPSLYYYVKNKDDILVQILNTAMQEIEPAIRMAEQADVSGMEKLRMFLSHYVVVLCGDFGKCLIMSGLSPLEEESQQKLLPAYRRIDSSVRAMIEEGIRDGSISAGVDPKIGAFALFGAIHWIPTWYDASGELNSREIADRLFAIFQSGLKTAADAGQRKRAPKSAPARAKAARPAPAKRRVG
jgi:AcrR family transcriptional regulator